MRTPVVKLTITAVVILLLGSLGYTALNLHDTRELNIAESRRHFNTLVDEASMLYDAEIEEKNRVFSLLREHLRDFARLRSFVLFDTDGRLHYVYGRNKSALSFTRGEHAEKAAREAVTQYERSRYDTSFITSVPVEIGLPFSVTAKAVYEIIPRSTVFGHLKLLLFALTGILLILAAALLLFPSRSTAAAQGDSFYSDGTGIPSVPPEYYEQDSVNRPGNRPEDRSDSLGRSGPVRENREAAPGAPPGFLRSPQPHGVVEDAAAPSESPAAAAEQYGAAYQEDEASAAQEQSGSFFSPTTQLVRERFFLPRLESELKRAASFDQDLTLLLLRSSAQISLKTFAAVADATKSFFSFHDLIFELPEYTVAVVLPNTDLDGGVGQGREFQKSLLKDARFAAGTDIRMGLSARNGRLVEAQRVYEEACAALRKAEHDAENPSIIGFRPDPNKYRTFLSGQQN
jgi:hypothetical protein